MSKINKWFQILKENLETGTKRFPITIGFSALAVLVGIFFNHVDTRTYINSIMGGLLIAIPLSGCLAQVYGHENKNKVIQLLGTVIPSTAYALTLSNDTGYFNLFDTNFFQLNVILYALFFIMPYYKHDQKFSEYVFYNVGKFFLTALYALILFGGLSAVYFTIDVLFELDLMEEVYFDLFMVSAGIFGTTHFLGHLPKWDERDLPYSLLFKRLFLYIVLPLLCVYDVILHAYFIKILIQWQLPEGMIGHLVVWFGIIGVVTWFFLNDLRGEYPWLNKLGSLFTVGMIAPLGMLFIAAFIRVSGYGITELRYYLIMAGAFELISFTYLFMSREKANVRIAVVGVIFVAVSSFGPLSAENMTISNQNGILKDKLEAYRAFNTGGEITLEALETDAQADVNQTASYIANEFGYESLYFFDASLDSDREALEERTGLNLDYYYNWKYADTEVEYIREFVDEGSQIIPLEGADYLLRYNSGYEINLNLQSEGIFIKMEDEDMLSFSKEGKTTTIDMLAWFKTLEEPTKDQVYRMGIRAIEVDDLQLNIKWVITGLSAEKREDVLIPTYIESYVIISVDK